MDAYIFDFGRVLIDFDTRYMTEVYIKDREDAALVESVAFDRIYWDKLDEGTISDDEVKQGIKSRLPQRLHEKACMIYDNWYKNLNPVKGMYELVRKVKASGKKIYLLSNISKGFAEHYEEVPHINDILSIFDGLVFSGDIGIVKPNGEIYKYILHKYNLDAKKCIFIDDNPNNIVAAKELGINTYLFDGDAERLSAYINL